MERLKDLKVIISDWDDTKVATFNAISKLVDRFANNQGLCIPGKEGLRLHWGKPTVRMFDSLWPGMDPKELLGLYQASVPPDFSPPPLDGVEKTVRELVTRGLRMGIITSGRSEWVRKALNRHYPKIADTYLFIHGDQECEYHKPNSRVFDPAFDILRLLGITEGQTLYVGDSLDDYWAARDRGMVFIATTTGNTLREQFIEAGLDPKLIISSFNQLPSLLKAR